LLTPPRPFARFLWKPGSPTCSPAIALARFCSQWAIGAPQPDALRLVQFSDSLSASALTALADAAIANNEWSKADQLLQRAWLKAPEAGRIATRRAGVLRRLGNAGAAAQWDARANDAEPLVEDPILLIVAEQSLFSSHFLQAANWASGETGTMR